MERFAEKIVQKCVQTNLIEEDQSDWLFYSLQRRFMNIGGFLFLILLGVLIAPFQQVLLLNLGLAFLREKTNGLHMPTKLSCFVFSLICEYSCLFILHQLQENVSFVSAVLLVISTGLIVALAPCNNAAIHCSLSELQSMKKSVYKRLALYGLIVVIFIICKPILANTLIVAESAVALLVALSKLGVGVH